MTRHVAVVGSGPSGFYAAEALLNASEDIVIDMFERLPTPYGLVRSGVAPDHLKLKQVTLVFDKIMRSERFHFLGNVSVGTDVPIDALLKAYDGVVLAYGACADRKMSIAGEGLTNSHSATEFVGWYNGHPDFRDRTFDLGQETAVVVGHGNVAADVARILLQPPDDLRRTDIAAHALDALAKSKVREVHLVGRRGPAQAKFTTRELRGLGTIPGCESVVDGNAIRLGPACEVEISEKSNLNALQNVQFFRGLCEAEGARTSRRLIFHFCLSPERLEGEAGKVDRFVFRKNSLRGGPFDQTADPTDDLLPIECGLVFGSIGYRGQPLERLPFDSRRGVVPNRKGRVESDGITVDGLYVTGWLKRGPTGIIGTNRADSIETVQQIMEDFSNREAKSPQGRTALSETIHGRSARIIGLPDWLKIDAAECAVGRRAGKPREKFTRIAEMLEVVSVA
ncbi:NADP oxidoreductase [Bradyrhizobium tropiciagri]|uniref:NADP oxidoreductase n=1 Tax=Bradyrhizobium tropiciagri TaxID=312253 RepID=UPI0020117299|nr:NADP oxidoreductase [Bradyrhizobium tropiciagri]